MFVFLLASDSQAMQLTTDFAMEQNKKYFEVHQSHPIPLVSYLDAMRVRKPYI